MCSMIQEHQAHRCLPLKCDVIVIITALDQWTVLT